MPRHPNHWILLTNPHISEIYISPDWDRREYQIAPNDNLRPGDIVYLWAVPHDCFYGWGQVASTPMPTSIDVPMPDGDIQKKKRLTVAVSNIKELHPNITGEMMYARKDLRRLIPASFDDLYAVPLRPGQAHQLNDFIREYRLDAPQGSVSVNWLAEDAAPQIDLSAVLTLGDKTKEGQLVIGVRIAWHEIIRRFRDNPEEIYRIDPRTFEEIIAGAYEREGYMVELTPRSGDKGRDIIATRSSVGSIRILDQVKRYKISRPVPAEEVRAMLGVITADPNVTKGIITTTSTFAPELLNDENLARFIPHRLELKPRDVLFPWLEGLVH